jgi:hypothetical protein
MAEFTSFKVWCFDPDFLALNWALRNLDPTYTISVERSESPEGPWDVLNNDVGNRDTYLDWTANLNSKYRMHYYRLKYTGTEELYSSVAFVQNAPDAEAVDVARRMSLALEMYNGTPGFFLISRSWGPRCPKCYDKEQHKVTSSKCAVCYGLGYAGGFFDPIFGYTAKAGLGQKNYVNVSGLFEMDPDARTLWTGNYPLLKPRDMFVDNNNEKWVVKAVNFTEKMGAILRQTFTSNRVPKDDILYKLEVPSLYEFEPRRDYHTWVSFDTARFRV